MIDLWKHWSRFHDTNIYPVIPPVFILDLAYLCCLSFSFDGGITFPLAGSGRVRVPAHRFHGCPSAPTGVILPLHCVRGLHHAALLYAGRHHRQRPDLHLSHPCVERLPVHDSWPYGTDRVAGNLLQHIHTKQGIFEGITIFLRAFFHILTEVTTWEWSQNHLIAP